MEKQNSNQDCSYGEGISYADVNVTNNNNDGNNTKYTYDTISKYVFPPGYRFDPTDEELIIHYLNNKIKSEKLLPPHLIHDVNIYKYNPDYLAETFQAQGLKIWYFFTPRDRKYPNGTRPNRAAGNGYWKATGADKAIIKDGKEVGHRKALVFNMGKPPRGDKTSWIMHEFRVAGPSQTNKRKRQQVDEDTSMRLDDYVLCRIYNKEESRSKNPPLGLKQETEDDGEEPENQEEQPDQAEEEIETFSASFLDNAGPSNTDFGVPQTMSHNENTNNHGSMMNNATPVDRCSSSNNQAYNFPESNECLPQHNLPTTFSTSYGSNEYISQQAVLPPNFEEHPDSLLDSPSDSMYTSGQPACEDFDELSRVVAGLRRR